MRTALLRAARLSLPALALLVIALTPATSRAGKPSVYKTCQALPNDTVRMATCGSVLVAYQDIAGAASMSSVAYDAFNQGLVQGMAQSADTTPAVQSKPNPFVINGKPADGQYMRVDWTQQGEPRTLTGYSVATTKKVVIRLGACFGLAGPGSEAPCLELLPFVMKKGLK